MADISHSGVGGVKSIPMHGKLGGTYAIGMALTLTGGKELGFGVAGGSPAFGSVTKVEIDAKDADGKPTDIVLGVQNAGFTETVKMTSTAANRPTIGSPAYCNDKGELVKAPDTLTGVTCGVVEDIDIVKNTASVRWF